MKKFCYLLLFLFICIHTSAFCTDSLYMTLQKATEEDISAATKGKSKEEKKFIKKCPIVVVEIKNAEPYEEYFLMRKDLLGNITKIGTDPKKGDAKIILILDGYFMPGEPVEIIAVSADQVRTAKIRVIPSPIETKSKTNTRRLSIESCSSDRKIYAAHLEGFQRDEPLEIIVKSGDNISKLDTKFNEEKAMNVFFTPALPWMAYGNTTVEVHAKNPDETLKVDFEWGVSSELLGKMKNRYQ